MKKFIQSWVINTAAVLAAVYMVPGIRFKDETFWTPVVTALVLGILNAFIRYGFDTPKLASALFGFVTPYFQMPRSLLRGRFTRPILMLFALPLLIFTLGLFRLVINAMLLYFVGFLLHGFFEVDNFGAAFVGAIIISVVSLLLNLLIGGGRSRVHIERRRPPPDSGRGGSGPVIDV